MRATAIANSNIAFIKYWGKKDVNLNLPMNPSLSMTLDEGFSTTTSVEFSARFKEDMLVMNDIPENGEKLEKVSLFLDIVRNMSGSELRAKVDTANSFPTGAGIASSASGFAALALASSSACGLELNKSQLSALARRGSGSAARSIFGGFSVWEGESASQAFASSHWPEIRDIVVFLDKGEKKVSSRIGMQRTVETSMRYRARQREIPARLAAALIAIRTKDFANLAKIIMSESDSLHECMLDTIPRLDYMNDSSRKLKEIIKKCNGTEIISAYTFDAGPNAHIITLDKDLDRVLRSISPVSRDFRISHCGAGARLVKVE